MCRAGTWNGLAERILVDEEHDKEAMRYVHQVLSMPHSACGAMTSLGFVTIVTGRSALRVSLALLG